MKYTVYSTKQEAEARRNGNEVVCNMDNGFICIDWDQYGERVHKVAVDLFNKGVTADAYKTIVHDNPDAFEVSDFEVDDVACEIDMLYMECA